MAKKTTSKTVETLKHDEDKRKNIPTAEYQSVLQKEQESPRTVKYPRNTDLDPQLVWRGKDEQDWSDLVTYAPPLYIQEKVHPKVLIDDLLRQTKETRDQEAGAQPDLFADFNGMAKGADKTEFYQHDQNWSNRMILGDSLQVMASLAEREGLRGKVQCIYLDPPYGIKFNSNFQWSTTSRDVKDGNAGHITREPEQVKAFRDTWRDGIHSYLTYLRDRLTVARDLLTNSGSIFVQIGDENVHRVRALMDEVFGDENFVSQITFQKNGSGAAAFINNVCDYILWFSKSRQNLKFRPLIKEKTSDSKLMESYSYDDGDGKIYRLSPVNSQGFSANRTVPITYQGVSYQPGADRHWSVDPSRIERLLQFGILTARGKSIYQKLYLLNQAGTVHKNIWDDTAQGALAVEKLYVVQTSNKVIERCILMATDPGDLVLDPTCGSGTTAYVAEQWGRRWITIDTSRVALALARARIMGARYPFYLLADSREGQEKEGEVTRTAPSTQPVHGNIRHGFVYERVPHITLKSIANNAEIDVIWENHQPIVEQALAALNRALADAKRRSVTAKNLHGTGKSQAVSGQSPEGSGQSPEGSGQSLEDSGQSLEDSGQSPEGSWQSLEGSGQSPEGSGKRLEGSGQSPEGYGEMKEWEVPFAFPADWPKAARAPFDSFRAARIARQKEIDASIAAKAEFEYLYDKPYADNKKVRVAGPFTVESLRPHRVLGVDENDDLIDSAREGTGDYAAKQSFPQMILENLKTAGVQQAHKEDRISFIALTPWPGHFLCAEGRYLEGEQEKRAGILIGPEFGTLQRIDLVEAAKECGDAGFDVLIACAFNYDAQSTDFAKLGRIPVLKARMNADLHMADDLKNTGKGNLFVIFGEPDIDLITEKDGKLRVKVNGVDIFKPQTGEVISDNADGIACWFIDTDYNEESFFVRHAYFLGANDPYSALKTTLKAEINEEAWATLHSDTSRSFEKPKCGRIAVKVINHLGDEVMKVFRVE